MFSIEDCIIQLATTQSLPLGHAPVRFRPPTVRRKREKVDESISRIYVNKTSVYKGSKILRAARSQRVKVLSFISTVSILTFTFVLTVIVAFGDQLIRRE
ncbi:hypothetical protein AVEN_45772-1 [Araneus ventricosus]|uniref:Uncharacterized protein n=1 Tax=Araneus ventricosus TaxID=182803 RepID=A0A4Y2FFT6_ARAVE|nr:hypothetical protein AVEN_45772-1 [Araneus ventricosus]